MEDRCEEYVAPEIVEYGDWQKLIKDSSVEGLLGWGKCSAEEVTNYYAICS